MGKIIKLEAIGDSSVSSYTSASLDDYLDSNGNAALDAAALLADAKEDAEQKVREAYAEGMRRGMVAGEEKFNESVGETAEMLSQTAETLSQARAEFLESFESQLVQLAASIAEKILNREAQTSTDVIQKTVRSVLERVLGEERVSLHVHPADIETLREHRIKLLDEFEGINRIDLVADDSVAPGGCVGKTERLRVDGRLASQLEQIMNELLD